ncbi:MAG: ShlB/FhaC/HecB family hemolysin secretion/activation protein [Burkholderiaceae bacterium]|jgi:hemolysin activation/secretion protein
MLNKKNKIATHIGRSLLTVVSTFVYSNTAAQTIPDAGSILQQLERDKATRQQPKALQLNTAPAPEAMSSKNDLRVHVKRFEFAGNNLLSTKILEEAVQTSVNKSPTFKELQLVTDNITKLYTDAGYVARVYLPKQDITEGTITIQIIEAVFGKINIDNQGKRIPVDLIKGMVQSQQASGEYLSLEAIDRSLLMINEIPGVRLQGGLSTGSVPQSTDLSLALTDTPLLSGNVGIDNTGSRATGPERLTVNGYLLSPRGLGDMGSINTFVTRGSEYVRLGYSIPVGIKGLRLGVNSSFLHFDVITPEFSALAINGQSNTFGLDASYPLIKSRTFNLNLLGNLDQKNFLNNANGTVASDYKISVASITLGAQKFDQIGSGGVTNASAQLVSGHLDLGGQIESSEDTTLNRSYSKLKLMASREQVVTSKLALFIGYSTQFASQNLDSSEKFYLGGASGIRAYPTSEGGGARGQLLTIEIRRQLEQGITLTGFYDWGRVMINTDNGAGQVSSPAAINRFDLSGVGASLTYLAPQGITIKGIVSQRLGSNPLRNTTTGFDSDGSFTQMRMWITASKIF